MALSKKWASLISIIASYLFCFIIVFQIPLFRVPCRNKICETPIEVISSQLIGSVPSSVVKTLLYPGTIAKSLLRGSGLPNCDKLFKFYNFHEMKRSSFSSDIQHLEVFAGSSLCLLGALLSMFKPRRISFIGTLLIFWGLIREIVLLDSAHGWISEQRNSVRVYPTLFLSSFCAFLSIRSDVRKIIKCCTSKPFSKSL